MEYAEKTGRLQMLCPFHPDSTPSSGFYTSTELFHCFACEITLPPAVFYARYKDVSYADAQAFVESIWGTTKRHRPDLGAQYLRLRRSGERLLEERRSMHFKDHAKLAEALDKLLFKYERGEVKYIACAKEFEKWKTTLPVS